MVKLGPGLKQWEDDNMEELRYQYDLLPTDYVIDIGSYRREWADEITKRYGCKVECFDALDDRAAWVKDGEIEMCGQYYYTSAYDEQSEKKKFGAVHIAPFMRQEIALCKINIEGMEYDLLNYIYHQNIFCNVKNFQIQFHEIEQREWQIMYEAIVHKLSYTHELTWRIPFVWENWRRKV